MNAIAHILGFVIILVLAAPAFLLAGVLNFMAILLLEACLWLTSTFTNWADKR